MKRYLLLMPVILATSAAIADTQATAPASRADAQAQAAALLSRPHTSGGVKAAEVHLPSPSPASTTADAQAQAAALLSGVRPASQVSAFAWVVEPRPVVDAQAQAAALLTGSRSFIHAQVQAEGTSGRARKTGNAF
jgi:hypothetical protein